MGLRAWLALLGIMVGSASVVALLEIGRSASEDAMLTFKGLGTDTLVASFPGPEPRSAMPAGRFDTAHWKALLPVLAYVAPITQYSTRIQRSGAWIDASVIGTAAGLAEVVSLRLREGRFISRFDRDGLFVVVGSAVAQALRVAGRPLVLNDLLQIGDYQFQVIGLLEAHTHNPLLPLMVDESVFVTRDSMPRLSSSVQVGNVIARIQPGVELQVAAAAFESLLSKQLAGRQVQVQVPRQLLDGLQRQADTFTWLLVGLGAISLLVAGVGVMNVMLMNVSERRREIGLRMALGARPRDIRQLFLLEAAQLSVAGALLGALLGSLIAWGFIHIKQWPLALSITSQLLGVGCALSIGLFFGYYPALSASRLSPAVALRDD